MKLDCIKTTACPVCGCTTVVRESIETDKCGKDSNSTVRVHCNGGVWEHREFLCGYSVEYIPNFSKEYVERKCSQDPAEMEQNRLRNQAKVNLFAYIGELDCDEHYKATLINELRFN